MTTTDTLPDVEGGIRQWLRDDTALTSLISRRVFFGVPKDPTFPLVTVARVGGGDDDSEAPIDRCALRINVWGAKGDSAKAGCFAVKNAVRAALYRLRGRTTVTTGVDVFGASVNADLWAPDPADDRARYTLTVLVTAIATS